MITSLDQLDLSKQYTYADYLKWRFQERVELIRGRIFKMSPAPARKHQAISRYITSQMVKYFENRPCEWYYAPFDVRLPRKASKADKQVYTVVQPDICVICDKTKLDKRGCVGAPDLIIEILSPGNSKKEMKDKFEVYEEAGVREYWIVQSTDNNVLVYTLNEQGIFIGHRPFIEDEIMHSFIFPELKVDLREVFKD
ncbi:Uma2 family endonuclease [Runella sp. MFBS21]|uniref:Uma2 family endonuclease n=1 Tax=Runella sp. MFBS21 TaxID=3034018 RepID=UPI0023F9BC50|nr:Uma2 family endonuclease [Runella sp. MFBS21]MDF7819406.1 Uma2 family endonuclease [Runella sp. MFBS21]